MDFHSTSNLAADLGIIPYLRALDLQHGLVSAIKAGSINGALLFLEHESVYTIGRKADPANYPGINPVRTERGGDITYHGPGQLVVYPILRIDTGAGLDVRKFVKTVEDIVIHALSVFGYSANVGEEPGVWVAFPSGNAKVASIGMAIDHGISLHGVAINISPDVLTGFSAIRPCGLPPAVMGYVNIDRSELIKAILKGFASHFGEFSWTEKDGIMEIAGIK
ncbi:MAG: lipoyl(octanoyl) transferase LipB [Candidatus Thermoplasmatota archaeon]|nr:lipoyl(octanoyl) transferase LipB [Candidatus Thermoplasmatota archaeon]